MTIFLYKGLIRNMEIEDNRTDFCPISGDWGKLGIPNLAQMSIMKCYWIQQNPTVTAFTVYEFMSC